MLAIPPPSIARLLLASLGLVFFSPTFCVADNVQKLALSIPPGHSELDDLQKDYEKGSRDLQASFEFVQKYAPACNNGAQISQMVAKGAPWQKAQREKIIKALNSSTADLQTEIARLDQTAADSAGNTNSVSNSKTVIAAGIDKPRGIIQKELLQLQAFTFRLKLTASAASQLMAGDSADCVKARSTFLTKMKPQAEALPEKLRKLTSALSNHRSALNAYADSVSHASQNHSARAPASR